MLYTNFTEFDLNLQYDNYTQVRPQYTPWLVCLQSHAATMCTLPIISPPDRGCSYSESDSSTVKLIFHLGLIFADEANLWKLKASKMFTLVMI